MRGQQREASVTEHDLYNYSDRKYITPPPPRLPGSPCHPSILTQSPQITFIHQLSPCIVCTNRLKVICPNWSRQMIVICTTLIVPPVETCPIFSHLPVTWALQIDTTNSINHDTPLGPTTPNTTGLSKISPPDQVKSIISTGNFCTFLQLHPVHCSSVYLPACHEQTTNRHGTRKWHDLTTTSSPIAKTTSSSVAIGVTLSFTTRQYNTSTGDDCPLNSNWIFWSPRDTWQLLQVSIAKIIIKLFCLINRDEIYFMDQH